MVMRILYQSPYFPEQVSMVPVGQICPRGLLIFFFSAQKVHYINSATVNLVCITVQL